MSFLPEFVSEMQSLHCALSNILVAPGTSVVDSCVSDGYTLHFIELYCGGYHSNSSSSDSQSQCSCSSNDIEYIQNTLAEAITQLVEFEYCPPTKVSSSKPGSKGLSSVVVSSLGGMFPISRYSYEYMGGIGSNKGSSNSTSTSNSVRTTLENRCESVSVVLPVDDTNNIGASFRQLVRVQRALLIERIVERLTGMLESNQMILSGCLWNHVR